MSFQAIGAVAGVGAARGASEAAATSFGEVLRSRLAAGPPAAPTGVPGRGMLVAVELARQRLDAALAEARSGRTFTPAELLALQSDAYAFSHTVEMASRVVESGAQSLRQAVNTQV